jgi:hypothetical protein
MRSHVRYCYILILLLSLNAGLTTQAYATNNCLQAIQNIQNQARAAVTSAGEKAAAIMFEDPRPFDSIKYGLFVHKPGLDQKAWIKRYWYYLPRKMASYFIEDENYVFSPLETLVNRPFMWLSRMTIDWPTRFVTKIALGQQKVFSRYVRYPSLAVLLGASYYLDWKNEQEANSALAEIAAQPQTTLVALDALVVETFGAKTEDKFSVMYELYRKNASLQLGEEILGPADFEHLVSTYFIKNEGGVRYMPKELLSHIEKIVRDLEAENSAPTIETQHKMVAMTHAFYFNLDILKKYLFQPAEYNTVKLKFAETKDQAMLEFMSAIEENAYFKILIQQHKAGKLSALEVSEFTQKYIYCIYLSQLIELTGSNLANVTRYGSTDGLENPVRLSDLLLALKTQVARLAASR